MLPGRVQASLALGILISALSLGELAAREIPFDPPQAKLDPVPRDIVTGNDHYCMTLAIFFEGGSTGESEEGQRHIARVIHERARADRRKWGGNEICKVVFYHRRGVCQFTFACLPLARRTPTRGPAWRYAASIARDEIEGRSPVEERSIRYYMNPALTPARNACRFRKEFVPVVVAGRHHFFREPTPAERVVLARSEFPECTRAAKAKSKTNTKSTRKGPARKTRMADVKGK